MKGYIDLQVNGYAGVDFNSDDVDDAAMVRACEQLMADGVEKILATVITAPLDSMLARLKKIAHWIDTIGEVRSVVAGIHIEGPFISPLDGFVGAHPRDAVVCANLPDAEQLIQAGAGWVKLLTLAPECDDHAEVTSHLTKQGIVVAAGHSDATLDQLDRSMDAGLRMFTHLGNGCPATMARHDNIIQRVLSRSASLTISFIADGHHVPMFALKNYLSAVPEHRVVIVSDAISAAGLGPGVYELAGQSVYVDDHLAAWAACRTHFAGCATPLKRMEQIMRSQLNASERSITSWMRDNPAQLIGA